MTDHTGSYGGSTISQLPYSMQSVSPAFSLKILSVVCKSTGGSNFTNFGLTRSSVTVTCAVGTSTGEANTEAHILMPSSSHCGSCKFSSTCPSNGSPSHVYKAKLCSSTFLTTKKSAGGGSSPLTITPEQYSLFGPYKKGPLQGQTTSGQYGS